MHTRARSDGTRDTGSSADPLAADASAGWFRLEGVEDRCGDVIRCGENFVVPESDHSIAHQFDLLSSLGIKVRTLVGSGGVAIDFDYESCFEADEVRDVHAECVLPAKFETAHALGLEDPPHAPLGGVFVSAELTGPPGVERIASHDTR